MGASAEDIALFGDDEPKPKKGAARAAASADDIALFSDPVSSPPAPAAPAAEPSFLSRVAQPFKDIGNGLLAANDFAARAIAHPIDTFTKAPGATFREGMRGINENIPFANRAVEAIGGPAAESPEDAAAAPGARAFGNVAGMVPVGNMAGGIAAKGIGRVVGSVGSAAERAAEIIAKRGELAGGAGGAAAGVGLGHAVGGGPGAVIGGYVGKKAGEIAGRGASGIARKILARRAAGVAERGAAPALESEFEMPDRLELNPAPPRPTHWPVDVTDILSSEPSVRRPLATRAPEPFSMPDELRLNPLPRRTAARVSDADILSSEAVAPAPLQSEPLSFRDQVIRDYRKFRDEPKPTETKAEISDLEEKLRASIELLKKRRQSP